jgi:O-antigen/teichoic acid export membrane protein
VIDRLGGFAFTGAVVRETEADHAGLSSIFWLSFGCALAVTLVLAGVRSIYVTTVSSLLVAYGLRLLAQSVALVPDALMKRSLRYRELSIIKVVSNFADVGTKMALAASGVHVWCFVLGPVVGTIVYAIGVQLRMPWRPRRAMRRDVARRALRFAGAVQGAELLYHAYTNADYIVVGAWFGPAAVGAYRLAYELVLDVVRLLSNITTEVAFPTFVALARDAAAVGAQLIRFTRQNLIVLAPFLVFVVVEADDLLELLYPPLPHEAATAARILAVTGALRTLGFIVPPMLAGIGEARRVLFYNAIASAAVPLAFVLSVLIAPGEGFVSVAVAWAVGYPVAFTALLAMALPRARLTAGAYARAVVGIVGCAAAALAVGVGARIGVEAIVPGEAVLRVAGVAVAMLASYGGLLAVVERVTPASVVRGLRK